MSKDKMIMVTTDDSLRQQWIQDRKEVLYDDERLAIAKEKIESVLKEYNVGIEYDEEEGLWLVIVESYNENKVVLKDNLWSEV